MSTPHPEPRDYRAALAYLRLIEQRQEGEREGNVHHG